MIIYFEQILHPSLFSKADQAEVIRTMGLGYRADKREHDNQFEGCLQIGLRSTLASLPHSSCSPQPEGLEITIKSLTIFSVLLLPNLALSILLGLNKHNPLSFFLQFSCYLRINGSFSCSSFPGKLSGASSKPSSLTFKSPCRFLS